MDSHEVKEKSQVLEVLAKKFGYEIKHSHALEIMSQLENKETWNLTALRDGNYIKTGIKALDQDLCGGLKRGTLTSILGLTNIGKTTFCTSIVCKAIKAKRKVSVYALEGQEGYTEALIIANLSGIPLRKILNKELTAREEKHVSRIKNKKLSKYLKINEKHSASYSIEDLKKDIFNERYSFKFDLLCIDYGQLITVDKSKDYRMTMAQVFRMLSTLANVYDCAVITPVIATRATVGRMKDRGDNVVRAVDIAECFEIARVSSNIISINATDEELKNDEMRVYLEKQREGIKGTTYHISTDFKTSTLIK